MRSSEKFLGLVDLTPAQLDSAADGMHTETPVLVRADPSGAYVLFTSSGPTRPYELDLVLVQDSHVDSGAPQLPGGFEMLAITTEEVERLRPWAARTISAICKRWRERHPPMEN